MSYNGSGTFQINTSGQPVVAGTVISSTAFNALTADLATGLSTAITKDGQTTTTARIPFAQGISSTLTTDSSSVSTGSIITAGGVGIAKNLYVGANANVAGTLGVTGVATFSAAPIYSSLTASSAVATDASKGLVSVTNTGTGNNVLATSPTLVTPVLGAASATSVTVAAGTVSDPAITTTGDTNTGIFFPAADTIAFAEGGAEAMRIDSSGNVGIGTSSPASRLNIATGASTSCTMRFTANNTGTGAGDRGRLDFYSADNSGTAYQLGYMDYDRADGTGTASYIAWASRVSGTVAERMRIDSSGNLLVGTTSATGKFTVSGNAGASRVAAVMSNTASDAGSGALLVSKFDNVTTTSQVFVAFAVNNNAVANGQINANGASSVAFGSYSDSRLKENIVDLPSQLANIMALRPVEYDYIQSEGGGHQIGFIAQEVETVYPDLVGERADGMLTLTDLNKNDARLIKCIQEQQALITALTARITALENK